MTTFQSDTFPGVTQPNTCSGSAFPAYAPGTLVDADKHNEVAAGVTLDSRTGISTSVLLPIVNAGSGSIPTGCDKL